MSILFGILILLFIGLAAGITWVCDALVKHQYKYHYYNWENDGRPTGFIWSPPKTSFLAGSVRRNRVLTRWLIVTPIWGAEDPRFRKLIYIYRLLSFIWLLIPGTILAGMFVV